MLNVNETLNVTGNISFIQLKNCDTINTDDTGLLTCGEDSGATDTNNLDIVNTSMFNNGSILRVWNITNILLDTFKNANFLIKSWI